MPVSEYFKDSGNKVLGDMQDRYGEDAGKRVFYATAEKRGLKPTSSKVAKVKKIKESVGMTGAKRALSSDQ